MTVRRSHYEMAFEAYLDRRGTPYVAVEDVRRFVRQRTGVKAFDYIVYPTGGQAFLVDVKGRKSTCSTTGDEWRQKTWVTRHDVEGLKTWQEVFGAEYSAVFVFAYWLAGGLNAASAQGGTATSFPGLTFAGREYRFYLAPLSEYEKHQKPLSRRWDTVSVPRAVFRSITSPLESLWPAAPC